MHAEVRDCMQLYYRALPRDGRLPGHCSMDVPDDLLGKRVIDVLCRKGKGAYQLSDFTGDKGFVLGVDPDASFVDAASACAAGNHWSGEQWQRYLRFEVGCPEDLSEAGVRDGSFDVAYVNSAINCVFDLALALAECARCLTPDGYLWVAQGVFRNADAPSVGAAASGSVLGNVFLRAVSLEQFEGLCLRVGFRSVEVLSRAVIVPDGDDARETCGASEYFQATVRVRR